MVLTFGTSHSKFIKPVLKISQKLQKKTSSRALFYLHSIAGVFSGFFLYDTDLHYGTPMKDCFWILWLERKLKHFFFVLRTSLLTIIVLITRVKPLLHGGMIEKEIQLLFFWAFYLFELIFLFIRLTIS